MPENREIRHLSMKINNDFLKQAGIFLLFLIGFWLVSVIFLWPATQGKALQQGDMQQVRLMVDAANKYTETTGIKPNWNDRLFSGMPANLITGIPSGNLLLKLRPMELFQLVKVPYNFLFTAMLSMFVLLLSCNVNRWLSAAGAIGYAFMTFSISSYEAGHITKVMATDVMPGMLAGLVLITRRQYILGAGVLGIFFAMLVGYFHYQIAYYAGIVAGVYLLIEMIMAFRAREVKHAIIATGLSVVMLGMGAATNIGKAIDTARYSEATMRGGSAVASEVPTKDGPKNQVGRKGLDIEYAFSWSYGIDESMTLLIPGFMGGSSNERVSDNEYGMERERLYHGELQFTSGPIYIGAIFIFLFILAIVAVLQYLKSDAVESKDKTVAITLLVFSIATVLISLMLGWGRHFGLNEWLFNNLPYYNKFRTPMMALVIAQMVIPFFGLYGLQLLLSDRFSDTAKKQVWKVSVIAISALMAVAALMLFSEDFKGSEDKEIMNQVRQQAMQSGQDEGTAIETATDYVKQIVDMRSGLAWGDWLRSMLLITLSVALIWYTTLKKQSQMLLWAGMLALISFDLMGVAKRYMTDDNWQDKEEEVAIEPTAKEAQLMAGNKENRRIFDLRYNPFNDNHPAPFFRNVGGYHPAKLSRYQDIISFCITPNGGQLQGDWINNNNALDMLNCGFVLSRSQDGSGEEIYGRPTALGHAWFTPSVKEVAAPKEALLEINKNAANRQVVVEASEKLKPTSKTYATDSLDVIRQTYYSFDTLKYESNSKANGLAVFSEVYYNEKNGSWKAFIDGKEAPVLRVNYILRATEVPAGKHNIEFVFAPADRGTFKAIETGTSATMMLLLIGALGWMAVRKEDKELKS